jgi:hypothetical protein
VKYNDKYDQVIVAPEVFWCSNSRFFSDILTGEESMFNCVFLKHKIQHTKCYASQELDNAAGRSENSPHKFLTQWT